jgi:hypothetical protein
VAAGDLRKISRALGLGRRSSSASLEVEARCALQQTFPVMSAPGLGRAKTKSDLVVMPSGRQIFAFFFALPSPQSPKFGVRLYRLEFSHSRVKT